jgi:hypothetical protein
MKIEAYMNVDPQGGAIFFRTNVCHIATIPLVSAYELAASQAREQQLREALDICKREMQGDKWDALYIDGVLTLPQDDTALRQWGAKLLKPALHAINEWADTFHNAIWHIQNIRDGIATPDAALANLKECQAHCEAEWDVVRRKADELEAGK